MGFVQGVHREQLVMFPESLDEYIGDDNPVRFIDAFVESLDLRALGFGRAVPMETGRPPYHPGALLKLYIYGYLNGVRSSRKLEKEANRNVEVMWLLGKLAPDFKTIADFRRDNGEAIRRAAREFTAVCRELELFGGQLVAIDGSRFKAVNSRRRNVTKPKLKELMEKTDKAIREYLEELDAADEEERGDQQPTAAELQEKIEKLKARKQGYQELQEWLEESGESQISLTDPDARLMWRGPGSWHEVSYNVQISVDAENKLIVDHEVTNACTDTDQLSPMAVRAKETLGVEKLEVLADKGYYNSEQVATCAKNGLAPYIPKPQNSSNKREGLYGKEDFRFDPETNTYQCPAGQMLTYRYKSHRDGREIHYYATGACKTCSQREHCTRNKRGRKIWRWVDEQYLDAMARRVRAQPEKVKLRRAIVEHPFGTMKHSMKQSDFLTRGMANVRTEMSLTVLVYNIKRALRLKGTQRLVAALPL
jgi:transposase